MSYEDKTTHEALLVLSMTILMLRLHSSLYGHIVID